MQLDTITPVSVRLTEDQTVAIELSISLLSTTLQRLSEAHTAEFAATQNLPPEYRLAPVQQVIRVVDVLQGILADGHISQNYVSPTAYSGRIAAISFASSNPFKIAEFDAFCTFNTVLGDVLNNLVDVLPPPSLVEFYDEDINSFIENSRAKAIQASLCFPQNHFAISEDSGIVIPGISIDSKASSSPLYGMNSVLFPGVVSARFGHKDTLTFLLENMHNGREILSEMVLTDETSTEVNNATLYELVTRHANLTMSGEHHPVAILNTFASVAQNGVLISEGHGSLVGEIAANDNVITRDTNLFDGHGYNPIFFVPSYGDFLDNISLARRTNFDHRSQAFVSVFTSLLLSLKVQK